MLLLLVFIANFNGFDSYNNNDDDDACFSYIIIHIISIALDCDVKTYTLKTLCLPAQLT